MNWPPQVGRVVTSDCMYWVLFLLMEKMPGTSSSSQSVSVGLCPLEEPRRHIQHK